MHPERRPDPDGSPESLEARLCGLPQPPVPAGLESKLLAAIPAEMPVPRRRWAVWAGVVGPLAAAGLLVVLTWPRGDANNPVPRSGTGESGHRTTVPSPGTNDSANQVTIRPSDESADIAEWREARRVLDGAEPATFTWPLEETSPIALSISLPANLLD